VYSKILTASKLSKGGPIHSYYSIPIFTDIICRCWKFKFKQIKQI